MLYVDSVQKSFEGKVILSDIFLSCERGEVVGIFGRNGSGKSTLLKIIFGCLEAEQKFVRADGKIIQNIRDGRRLINYLPQEHFLPSQVSVQQAINLYCGAADRAYLTEKFSGILGKKRRSLSFGQTRLVEVYLAIYSSAKIILLDEPFKGLAPLEVSQVQEVICREKKRKAFVITDHQYREAMAISDQMLLLKNGCMYPMETEADFQREGYLPS